MRTDKRTVLLQHLIPASCNLHITPTKEMPTSYLLTEEEFNLSTPSNTGNIGVTENLKLRFTM